MPIYKTDKKKDGKQQYRVFVTYTDNDGNQKRKTKCVYGLQEAREEERALSAAIKEASSSIKIRQLYDEYMNAKRHEVRKSSYAKTESILRNHLLNTPLFNKRLDKLSKKDLQEWKNMIAEKDIMISTKNNAYRELNTLLNYAVNHDYLPRNPLKAIGRFRDAYFTAQEEKFQYYTLDQFKQYIKAAEKNRKTLTDHACYVFFYLAFYTGLRKGELNALKWSDLDGDIIHVRRSLSQKTGEETPPKNKASYRHIRLPQNALKVLDDHRAVLQKNTRYSEDMRLCGGFKPIPDTALDNYNRACAAAAGLPHIRIHDFRHSHATFLINSGVNIMEVSRRLGHSDTSMTLKVYSHLYPSTEDEALKVLESA